MEYNLNMYGLLSTYLSNFKNKAVEKNTQLAIFLFLFLSH